MELSGVIFSTGATGSMNIDGQTNMKPPIGFRTISQKCSNYCRCKSSGVKSNMTMVMVMMMMMMKVCV